MAQPDVAFASGTAALRAMACEVRLCLSRLYEIIEIAYVVRNDMRDSTCKTGTAGAVQRGGGPTVGPSGKVPSAALWPTPFLHVSG